MSFVSNICQVIITFPVEDTDFGITRDTYLSLRTSTGLNDCALIQRALALMAAHERLNPTAILSDDGPLTNEQHAAIDALSNQDVDGSGNDLFSRLGIRDSSTTDGSGTGQA